MMARSLLRFLWSALFLLSVMSLAVPDAAWGQEYLPEACRTSVSQAPWAEAVSAELSSKARADLNALWAGYCQSIGGVEPGEKGLRLSMKSGAAVLYDDGRDKTFEQKLADPDLEDVFHQAYRPGEVTETIPADYDPGRFRNDDFLKAVYGGSEAEVRKNLTSVDFLGSRLPFNRANGAADRLRDVARDLDVLVKKDPGLKKYLLPSGGTFNWRLVAGTDRLSPHSYGMAVDLNTKYGAYWQWSGGKGDGGLEIRRKYPLAIVAAFEKHGFIWGGKWFHFDLMHFEYRPELFYHLNLTGK